MKSPQLHWHIFTREQIRPEHRGNLVYILELSATGCAPALRDIFDPSGIYFPDAAQPRLRALIESGYHGIIYSGLNKTAVYDVMAEDPPILQHDTTFAIYNSELIQHARKFFLSHPEEAPLLPVERFAAEPFSRERVLTEPSQDPEASS
jgi:hypothetical protein